MYYDLSFVLRDVTCICCSETGKSSTVHSHLSLAYGNPDWLYDIVAVINRINSTDDGRGRQQLTKRVTLHNLAPHADPR
jgi:hypothetical protein